MCRPIGASAWLAKHGRAHSGVCGMGGDRAGRVIAGKRDPPKQWVSRVGDPPDISALYKLGGNDSSWGFLIPQHSAIYLRKPSHRPVYILPNARRRSQAASDAPY
jgi:hypothetical protein